MANILFPINNNLINIPLQPESSPSTKLMEIYEEIGSHSPPSYPLGNLESREIVLLQPQPSEVLEESLNKQLALALSETCRQPPIQQREIPELLKLYLIYEKADDLINYIAQTKSDLEFHLNDRLALIQNKANVITSICEKYLLQKNTGPIQIGDQKKTAIEFLKQQYSDISFISPEIFNIQDRKNLRILLGRIALLLPTETLKLLGDRGTACGACCATSHYLDVLRMVGNETNSVLAGIAQKLTLAYQKALETHGNARCPSLQTRSMQNYIGPFAIEQRQEPVENRSVQSNIELIHECNQILNCMPNLHPAEKNDLISLRALAVLCIYCQIDYTTLPREISTDFLIETYRTLQEHFDPRVSPQYEVLRREVIGEIAHLLHIIAHPSVYLLTTDDRSYFLCSGCARVENILAGLTKKESIHDAIIQSNKLQDAYSSIESHTFTTCGVMSSKPLPAVDLRKLQEFPLFCPIKENLFA